jgi:uncharacterized integral membrane protein (TIGR00698 family)
MSTDQQSASPVKQWIVRNSHGFFSTNARGIGVAVLVAATAQFLGEHFTAPAMLFALLIGMAFNFLAEEVPIKPGVTFASKSILRVGVALLGLRIAFADIAELGLLKVEIIVGFIALTIATGVLLSKLIGRHWHYGVLTGGAVAICGASAALALSAVLPRKQLTETDTLLTVVGVTTLSTIAMVIYPVLFSWLGIEPVEAGFLIGATIHDVAQVVGAGFSINEAAGDIATIVKLVRVAMLPVVLILLTIFVGGGDKSAIRLPGFLIVFLILMLAANFLPIPNVMLDAANVISRACLLIAVAALGVKTSLAELRTVGIGKMMVIVGATLALLVGALVWVSLLEPWLGNLDSNQD